MLHEHTLKLIPNSFFSYSFCLNHITSFFISDLQQRVEWIYRKSNDIFLYCRHFSKSRIATFVLAFLFLFSLTAFIITFVNYEELEKASKSPSFWSKHYNNVIIMHVLLSYYNEMKIENITVNSFSTGTRPNWLGPGPSVSTLDRYLFTGVSTDSDMCGAVGTWVSLSKNYQLKNM